MLKKLANIVLWPFSIVGGFTRKLTRKITNRIFKPTPSGKTRWAFLFILILVIVASAVDYPKYYNQGIQLANKKFNWQLPEIKNYPFHLGLDLQGGTHLVYEADVNQIEANQKDSAVEGVRDVIERRVNIFGVAEPLVQTNRSGDKYQVVVELAGVKDVNEAIKMIGETPLLEFKEQGAAPAVTDDEKAQVEKFNADQRTKAEEVINQLKQNADFAQLVAKYSEDALSKDKGGDLGFVSYNSPFPVIYNKAQEQGANKTVLEIVEDGDGLNIIKIGESKQEETAVENKARHLLICWDGATRCEQKISKEEAKKKIDELKQQATNDNFAQLTKDNSTEPGAKTGGGELGWFKPGQMVKEFETAVNTMKVGEIAGPIETQFGYHLIYKEGERPLYQYQISRILLKTKTVAQPTGDLQWQNTGLTGKQLKLAQVVFDPNTNSPQISLEFNDEGKALFAAITERNVNKPVAIFLDNYPISVPRVNEPIKDGKAIITGNFNINDAKQLAQRLNSGALPVPIKLLSQQTIGATLGQDSIDKSLKAGVAGLIGVAIFMLLYYRLPGLLADLALIAYAFLMLMIFKLGNMTLTLSGIAGFILSIGIAVDANVLMFERLKEELRAGKPLKSAIDDAFKRAWPSIRDGNMSTLITCFILFQFGTSIIKGFAVILALGILVSMFSAIVITRILIKLIAPWFMNHRFLFGVKKVK